MIKGKGDRISHHLDRVSNEQIITLMVQKLARKTADKMMVVKMGDRMIKAHSRYGPGYLL